MLALLLVAVSGAGLVPASADAALVLDGASGAAGIRALLETAGRHTASLSPAAVGRTLSDTVGVDLLNEPRAWGLSIRGPRALVVLHGSTGLSAPVADPKAAARALEGWLAAAGPSRPTRQKPLKGPRAAGNRAGMIAPVGGGRRLLVASGPHAAALVSALAHPAGFTRDKALLARAAGPAWLYLKGEPPLRAAVFALEASSAGLVARGLVLPEREPILEGIAPHPCEGAPPGCLRASLGPSGRTVLAEALARLQAPALPEGRQVLVRLEGIEPQRLGDERSLPRALRIAVAGAPPAGNSPSLAGDLDLGAIASALARLTPIDALHGPLAAGAYAAHLVYGPLLRNAGPLTLSGTPAPKNGAQIELRLPLR